MSEKTRSITRGMSVLGLTGIICKFVGVLYSIPLARILGDQGLGLFQSVFPTYNLLLTVSSAGLPVAVSRMVSHFLAKDEPVNAKRVFRLALAILASIGALFTVMMFLSTGMLVRLVGVNDTDAGFRAIAPCVAFVCALSAFRGFIQGQQNMVPTAVSQLIEQIGKVAVSLPLAAVGIKTSLAAGAAGALAGITVVEALALIYMIVRYFVTRKNFDQLHPAGADASPLSGGYLLKHLIAISIPITVTACIVPFAQFIDSALMVKRMVVAGLAEETATAYYGIFSGMVIRLINIPTALALAISMSLVPAISAAKAVENKEAIRNESNTGIRYAFLIGFPCAVGMSILAKPILAFFYVETLSPERLQLASELLTFSALTVVLFTVVQATSSILQGLHRQWIPMITMAAGVALKILLNYLLIAIPGINIHGGPYASIVCYAVSMIPNLIYCCKLAGIRFNWEDWILRPGLAVLAMGVCVYVMKTFLPLNRLCTILEITVGVAVYLGVALADHAIKKEDLRAFMKRK